MKKTIHISKGQVCKFEDLTCERIVCNGVLKVSGSITAKRIQGDGVISATEIRCISCVQSVVSAEKIVCNELMARHVTATEVHAVSSLSVSTYIEAGYVKTLKAIVAEAEIEDMQATEIVKLLPKARSLWAMLIISQLRSWWVALVHSGKKILDDVVEKTAPDEADGSKATTTQAENVASDPEFQEFVSLFKAYKTGKIVFPAMGAEYHELEKPHQFTVVKSEISEDAA